MKLGDITGFFLSHDSTRGWLHIDASGGKAYLSTRGVKSAPGDAYAASPKYFEVALTKRDRALLRSAMPRRPVRNTPPTE